MLKSRFERFWIPKALELRFITSRGYLSDRLNAKNFDLDALDVKIFNVDVFRYENV